MVKSKETRAKTRSVLKQKQCDGFTKKPESVYRMLRDGKWQKVELTTYFWYNNV